MLPVVAGSVRFLPNGLMTTRPARMTASTDILKTGDLSSIAIPRLATDTYGAQRLRQRYAAGVPLRSTIGRIGKGSVNHDSIRNKPNAASAVLVQEVLAMNKHYWNKPVALRLPQRGVHEIEQWIGRGTALSPKKRNRDAVIWTTTGKSEKDERKTAKEQDDYLEEALEATFPASDPIAPGHVDKAPSDKK